MINTITHHTFFLPFHIIMVLEPLSDAGEFGFLTAVPAFSLVDQYSVTNLDMMI